MVRIAISSDNHLDVNQVDPGAALTMQADYLHAHGVGYYFFGGDLFNDFTRTRQYMADLRDHLAGTTRVYYVAGNHDLLQHAPYDLVEGLTAPGYLHNRYVDLPGTAWRVVGNNGWYDYSFSAYRDDPMAVQQWKRVYWLDSEVDQPGGDQDRMATVLDQVRSQLTAAKGAGRNPLRPAPRPAESAPIRCHDGTAGAFLPDDQCNDGQRPSGGPARGGGQR